MGHGQNGFISSLSMQRLTVSPEELLGNERISPEKKPPKMHVLRREKSPSFMLLFSVTLWSLPIAKEKLSE